MIVIKENNENEANERENLFTNPLTYKIMILVLMDDDYNGFNTTKMTIVMKLKLIEINQ